MHAGRFTVRLAKQDFKFSAAHFTLFPDGTAELLHGHNFQVAVAVAETSGQSCRYTAPLHR